MVQKAEATVTDAFELQRLIQIDPTNGDTLAAPARSQFPLDYDRRLALIATLDGELLPSSGPKILGVRPTGRAECAGVFRYGSGLPYSRTDATGDSLVVEPNGSRLPSQLTVDALMRRPLRFGRFDGALYLDVRNVLNRQNQISVRRDTGSPFASEATIDRLARCCVQCEPRPDPLRVAAIPSVGRPRQQRTDRWSCGAVSIVRGRCSRFHAAAVRVRSTARGAVRDRDAVLDDCACPRARGRRHACSARCSFLA